MKPDLRHAPTPWLLWTLAVLVVASTTRNPLTLALLGGVLWAVGEVLERRLSGRLALTLVGMAALWNFVTVHVGATVLFELPAGWFLIGGPYTLEAAFYGALNGLAIALLLSGVGLLTQVLSPRDVVRLTPPALYEAGLVLSVALAFLPQGRETLAEIRQAQAVRGHRVKGLRDLPPILLPLLVTALERALNLAEAMEARGFTSRRARIARRAQALLIAALLCWVAGVGGGLMGLDRVWSAVLLLAGGVALGAALRWTGRALGRTAYHPRRATLGERGIAAAALASLAMWSALSLLDPGLLAYQVYPTPTAPPFSLLAAFPVVLLAFPALVSTPPITSHVSRLTPHTSRVTSHASCLTPRVPRIVFDHVTFAYPEARTPVLRDVSLALPPGAFVLVTGPSGSGKSTLLRCINGLVPHGSGGTVAGNVRVGAIDALRAGPQEMANRVGLVVQSPEAGFVADRVEDEVAFALENAGIPPEDIGARVDEALAITGAAHLRERALATLSGGELQRVAVAAALALRPPVLLLDEPLSQLDPRGDDDVVAFLQELHAQGITVIVAEHRLERLLPCATQVVYLPGDGALWDDAPAAAAARIPLPPPVVELGRELGWEPLPLSVEEALDHASPGAHYVARITLPASCIPSPLLRASALTFTYDGSAALDGVDLTVGRGELVALVGPNGAGKTTLLRAITGLLKPQAGHVWLGDEEITSWDVAKRCLQIGYLPQEPDLLLFAESVTKELRITLDNHGLPDDGRVTTLLGRMGLARHAATYPRDLSVGERQRVALGAVAVTRPVCLLLDEPTRGLDMPLKVALGEMLRVWCAEGMGVLLVTHDVEWVARFADRVVLLDRGRVVAEGDPHDVLPARPDFAPQMARLFPNAGVLTVREVMASQV